MKLYTEEQLLNTVEAIRNYLKNYPEKFHESMIKKHLMNLAHIELPSDEEIGYTKQDVIKAGEMGEINYLDTLHIVTYLDEAKQFNETYGGDK